MKKIMTALTTVAWLFPLALFAQESGSDTYNTRLVEMKRKLDTTYKSSGIDHLNNADLYVTAISRISSAQQYLAEEPGSQEAPQVLGLCSLYVDAALLQMEKRKTEQEIRSLLADKGKVLGQLNEVHQAITAVERSYGTKLQADLASERSASRQLKEEADDKVARLEAERERLQAEAERLKQEAAQRFKELQSELINVIQNARGTIISMSDILFEVDKANLTGDLKTSLAKIAGILMVYKQSRIIVEGHTDNTGTKEYNQKLSERRAQNVMDFLVEQGVTADRLTAVGWGMTKPIADNTTKEGRKQNRRVDLVIQDATELPDADTPDPADTPEE